MWKYSCTYSNWKPETFSKPYIDPQYMADRFTVTSVHHILLRILSLTDLLSKNNSLFYWKSYSGSASMDIFLMNPSIRKAIHISSGFKLKLPLYEVERLSGKPTVISYGAFGWGALSHVPCVCFLLSSSWKTRVLMGIHALLLKEGNTRNFIQILGLLFTLALADLCSFLLQTMDYNYKPVKKRMPSMTFSNPLAYIEQLLVFFTVWVLGFELKTLCFCF